MFTRLLGLMFAAVALALCGCATASKLNSIHLGMTKAEVIAELGRPDSTSGQGNVEYLTYYLSNDSAVHEQPYMVRLVDAKVESFGRFVQLLDIYNRPVNGNPLNGVPPVGPLGMGAVMPMSVSMDLVTQLQQLKLLHDQGVLTDEEFQRAKKRLLADVN